MTGVPLLLVRAPFSQAEAAPDPSLDVPSQAVSTEDATRLAPRAPVHPLQVSQIDTEQPSEAGFTIAPPDGFEDLDGPVQTFFDVYYQDKRVGLFEGTLKDGIFTFASPMELALRLPGVNTVDSDAFLSGPLPSNADRRCLPGDQSGCGTLPIGTSGLVVDPERFRIDVFLGREYLESVPPRALLLGDPISGPSLIQNIAGSISASSQATETVRFGVVLDTYASVKKSSLVSRINADDSRGFRLQEAYAQQYFEKYRAAGGLIRDDGSANLDSTVFYGLEFSSFDRRQSSPDQVSGTPLDIVLPTASRVEIYRNGTLVSARQYAAGLQVLDSSDLPIGSYPVQIVARDSGGVIFDETRTFSKTPDLPPPGQTNFSLRAGVRAIEGYQLDAARSDSSDLLPRSTGESIIGASATRRISQSSAVRLGVTVVDGELYPEAELQLYKGNLRATTAVATGPDSQYSAVANVNLQWRDITSTLSARHTKADPLAIDDRYDPSVYRPFFQSEDSVYASVSMPVYAGALSLRASYSESDLADTRSRLGLSYTLPLRTGRLGNGILAFDAVSSDEETRIGVRLTLRRALSKNKTLDGAFGADFRQIESEGTETQKIDPLFRAGYSSFARYQDVALSMNVNAGTSNNETSAIFNGTATSRRGELDLVAGVSQRGDEDSSETFLASNIQTGFVISQSRVQFGTQGFGDAAVLVDLPSLNESDGAEGRFRVTVGGQSGASLRVGESAAILLPSLASASVGLVPEGAPPFDIDLSPREVPLYPGNVVHMKWKANYVVSAIGRLVDGQGYGIPNAIIQTSTDLAVTNQQGYFSITGTLDDAMQIRTKDGVDCGVVSRLTSDRPDGAYLRLGDITCAAPHLKTTDTGLSFINGINVSSQEVEFPERDRQILDGAVFGRYPFDTWAGAGFDEKLSGSLRHSLSDAFDRQPDASPNPQSPSPTYFGSIHESGQQRFTTIAFQTRDIELDPKQDKFSSIFCNRLACALTIPAADRKKVQVMLRSIDFKARLQDLQYAAESLGIVEPGCARPHELVRTLMSARGDQYKSIVGLPLKENSRSERDFKAVSEYVYSSRAQAIF